MNELLCLSIQLMLTPNPALIFKKISVKQFFFSPCNFSKNSKFKNLFIWIQILSNCSSVLVTAEIVMFMLKSKKDPDNPNNQVVTINLSKEKKQK